MKNTKRKELKSLDRIYRMYGIRETMVIELRKRSLNSSMGEHLVASNKLAYSGHQMPPITPDGVPSGAPAVREALSDLQLRDLRALSGSIFFRVIRVFRAAELVPKNSNLCELRVLCGELKRGRGHG